MTFIFNDAIEIKQEIEEENDEFEFSKKDLEQEKEPKTDKNQALFEDLGLKIDYLQSERGAMQFYRNSFLLIIRTALNQIGVKKWTKPSVASFVKEVYFNKEGFFTKDQIIELEELMAELNNEGSTASRNICFIKEKTS